MFDACTIVLVLPFRDRQSHHFRQNAFRIEGSEMLLGVAITGQYHIVRDHVGGDEEIPSLIDGDEGRGGAAGIISGDLKATAGEFRNANGQKGRFHEQAPAADAGLAVGSSGGKDIPISNEHGPVGGIEMNAFVGLNVDAVKRAHAEFIRGRGIERRIL